MTSHRLHTPSKLILTGEHAVVYGAPALAVAISHRNLQITAHPLEQSVIRINSMGLKFQQEIEIATLFELKHKIDNNFAQYQQGHQAIGDVLTHPAELLLYTLAELYQRTNKAHGLSLEIESSIPIGCGMGSSAAAIVGLLKTCSELLNLKFTEEQFYALAHRIENLQHGRSSGFDLKVIYHESGMITRDDQTQTVKLPCGEYYGVNTGTPTASTGECVNQVKPKMTDELLADFTDVSNTLIIAFKAADQKKIIASVRDNHQLLCRIGVVPERIQDFIHNVEQAGGAAKICGAGSVTGDKAGFVFLLGPKEKLLTVCQQFGLVMERLSWG